MLKTLALGTALGLLALTATAQAADPSPLPRPVVPEYDYECKSGERYLPSITCTLSEIFHPTQAPWDPRPGHTLMDQIPNWDGEANRVCCGHNPSSCQAHQSPRC